MSVQPDRYDPHHWGSNEMVAVPTFWMRLEGLLLRLLRPR